LLVGTSDSRIADNNIGDNYHGILLTFSSNNNTVIENNATRNLVYAIFVKRSDNNSIIRNNVGDNYGVQGTATLGYGLVIDGMNNCAFENNFVGNYGGVRLGASFNNSRELNNSIYHNNFINNTIQVYQFYASTFPNFWDDGYPSGGNYWSDYNGTDFYRGSSQNESGFDGIGDFPYVVDQNNTDRYPLMTPWTEIYGDVNGDRTVDIYDAILLANAYGSGPGSPNWNAAADINADNIVDIYDAILLANNFGKTA
jgi:parallel beta-helix repeat protein